MNMIHPGQWRLSRIQLINWGTFNGIVDIPVARQGFLITGGSGSGKSTLIDAISTVLIPTDRLKFNAAAQHEARRGKGRDLVSYIRGAWRTAEDLNTGTVVAQYLRPRATFSVIVLTYDNGTGTCHSLVALFYLRAGANSQADVVRLFGVLPNRSVTAKEFIPYLKRGLDKRSIKREFTKATFSENHSIFAAKFRPLLGISSIEAQLLLQRTQSAKSLDNLDHLFREYMLTEPDTFDFAQLAVEQFTDLEAAYDRVQDIKAQVEVLSPLEELHKTVKKSQAEIDHLTRLQEGLPAIGNQLKIAQLEADHAVASAHLDQATAKDSKAQKRLQLAEETYMLAHRALTGESEILRVKLDYHRAEHASQKHRFDDFCAQVIKNSSTPPTTATEFLEFAATAKAAISEHPEELRRLQLEASQSAVAIENALGAVEKLKRELKAAAKGRSNIAARYLELRTAICEEFNLAESELPFAGELIDISPQATEWEPVIQRLLSGFATQLLVPKRYHKEVVGYINRNHLRLKLRFNSIDATDPFTPKSVSARSLVHKVQVIPHEFQDWVAHELSIHYNFTCVTTPTELDELKAADKGVTINGLVRYASSGKDSTIRMLKDDYHQLGDRRHYRLGSSNQQRVELLRDQLHAKQTDLKAAQNKLQLIQTRTEAENQQYQFAQFINRLNWDDLDPTPLAEAIAQLEEQLAQLATHPEVQKLLAAEEKAKTEVAIARDAARQATLVMGAARSKYNDLTEKLHEAQSEATPQIDPNIEAEIHRLFDSHTRRVTTNNIEKLTLDIANNISTQLKANNSTLIQANNQISRILTQYIERWPAEKSDLEASPEFATEAIAKLQKLKGERLAEFSNQFRNLINDMSTRNLADIANRLRRAQTEIKERITPVNHSLRSSEFSTGRFLRIDVRDTRGAVVVDFQRDLDDAVSGGLSKQTEADAEVRYHKIAELIRRLGSKDSADLRWQKTVLDTRRHVSFIGVEVNDRDEVLNSYIDSSSLSGGQAQKLVFFCLAAALRYQLADPDAQVPRYATVILDEAFDRADPTYTERAMDVFTTFGFHMVLATPLKLISTLSKYVGNTIVISYDESSTDSGELQGQSALSQIDWERRS